MEEISLKALLEAGCHFGHKVERWHPKATSFIYQERDGIHVIDLVKTKAGLTTAADFIKGLAKEGKTVLFIGTKRQAAPIIKSESERVGASYFCKRWIGGFLTNWTEVHKNLEKIRRLTDEQKNNLWKKYPKHERVKLARYLTKLNLFYSGVVQLTDPPDALVVIDIKREKVAITEAHKIGIPVVAVVDTNSDPTQVDHIIPSNDDAVGAIELIVKYLAQAFEEGVGERQKASASEAKESDVKVDKKKNTDTGLIQEKTEKEKETKKVVKVKKEKKKEEK